MKAARFLYLVVLIFIFFIPSPCSAEIVLDDTFINTDYVDLNRTTARVDTKNGWVTLAGVAKPNAIAMKQFGYEYAVATAAGIKVFTYDDATGTMTENNALSVPAATDALGIAVRQDEPNIWVLTENELTLYKFNGGSMSTNPNLKVSGLSDVLSVSSWSTRDKAAILSISGAGTGLVEVYDATSGTMAPVINFDTGKQNPVAVSVVMGTPDLVVATSDAYYYYAYDDATGGYFEDPRRTVVGLNNVIAVSSGDPGSVVLARNDVQYYFNNDAGTPEQAVALSSSPADGVAISIKPDSYDYAVITEGGDVEYYTYNNESGTMARVSTLEVTGLELNGGYKENGEYYSVVITTGREYDEVRLTVDQDVPDGTSVHYFVTSDGGENWVGAIPGEWVTVVPNNKFAVKAVLATSDKSVAPKVYNVQLEASTLELMDLQIRAIAYNDPGQPVPITTFPARVKSGAEIQFEVITGGYAETVSAIFTTGHNVMLTPEAPVTEDENTWRGLYTVPADVEEGSTIGATVTAERGSKQKHLTQDPFILVSGSVLFEVDLSLSQ